MKKLIFITAVSGVGKSTVCDYIKNSQKLDYYEVFDIDDLENVHDYTDDTYNLFYENAIKRALEKSGDKNIMMASSINPTDIDRVNLPEEIEDVYMIAITCSNEELYKRLKARDYNRNCWSDDFIRNHQKYQQWILEHVDLYDLQIDNSNCDVAETADSIIDYIKHVDDVKKK